MRSAECKTTASNIKSPNRIQVKSEIIIPSTTNKIDTVIHRKKEAPAQIIVPPKPALIREVIKMSPAQLREAERLGYVQEGGQGKVLTKIGMKEFLPRIRPDLNKIRKLSDSDASTSDSGNSSFKGMRRKSDDPVIVLDGDESPQKTLARAKPIYKTVNKDPIVIPDEEPEVKEKEKHLTTRKEIEEKVSEASSKVVVSSDNSLGGSCSSRESSVVATKEGSMQDQAQILAVPAENFGGPTNAFYLCSVGEDGNLTPINNEALYLDASNQLVPVMPEAADKVEVTPEELAQAGIIPLNEESSESTVDVPNQGIILNTGDGQQIILDQQSILAMAATGEVPQLITQDGQPLILPGSAQEILNAIAASQTQLGGQSILIQGNLGDQSDILATALANTDVFQQEQLLAASMVELNPPVKAHVSETNTVLTQSPIMSTTEQPTKNNGKVDAKKAELNNKNLEDSLAEIGVTQHQTNVPVSLELPITVTNPAIASPKITNPLELSSVYPPSTIAVPSVLSPQSIPTAQELAPAIRMLSITSIDTTENTSSSETTRADMESNAPPPELSDEIIPDTPEALYQQSIVEEDSDSRDIPLQSNIVESIPEQDEEESTENHDLNNGQSNGIDGNITNNNGSEKHESTGTLDVADIPLPGENANTDQALNAPMDEESR